MNDIAKIFIHTKDKNKFNFAIKVKAGSKINSVDGTICINGIWHLKLSIKAIPESGKANIAIVKFLAEKWGVSKKSLKIIKGRSSNFKVLSIEENAFQK